MIKVESVVSEIKSKLETIDSSNNVNSYLYMDDEQGKSKKSKNINSKNLNNDIYKDIRLKAGIIIKDQREIQDRISLIQGKELKIEAIENALKNVKNDFIQAMQNGKKEELKGRIKIRHLSRSISLLKCESGVEDKAIVNNNYYTGTLPEENEKIMAKINEILNRINNIKGKLSQYKLELMTLSEDITSNRKKIISYESDIKSHLQDTDYVINGVTINTLDYLDLKGNIATGIIINIYI